MEDGAGVYLPFFDGRIVFDAWWKGHGIDMHWPFLFNVWEVFKLCKIG